MIQAAADGTMTLLPDSAIVSKIPVPRTGGWDSYQANTGDKLTIPAEGTALLRKWRTVGALLAAPSKFRPLSFDFQVSAWALERAEYLCNKAERNYTLTARSVDPATWHALNLGQITLTPVKSP